jgi:hypothetical protein
MGICEEEIGNYKYWTKVFDFLSQEGYSLNHAVKRFSLSLINDKSEFILVLYRRL